MHRLLRPAASTALALATLLFLTAGGCVLAPRPEDGPVLRPLEDMGRLAGRSYYALDPAASCRANDPARTRIRTWVEHLSFERDGALVWGTLCNDAAQRVSLDELRPALLASAGLDVIEYRGRRLAYAATEPRLCAAGRWCPVGKDEP